MHNSGNGAAKVLVLYQVANSIGDKDQFNAFEMPRVAGGIKLSTVKQHCHAVRNLSKAGPAGYQWRVRVDDRVPANSASNSKPRQKYSWWDIQDDNAPLPVKDVTFTEISEILAPPRKTNSTPVPEDSVTKVATGAMRSLGKAMNKVAATVEGTTANSATDANFPRVSILVFKLLDLAKIYDSFSKQSGHRPSRPQGTDSHNNKNSASQPTGRTNAASRPTPTHTTSAPRQPTVASIPKKQDSLLNFNEPASHTSNNQHRVPYATTTNKTHVAPTETRVEKLSREYKQKQHGQELVWDKIDQRYVTPDSKGGESVKPLNTTSTRPTAPGVKPTKMVGISLDPSNAVGKSAHVAEAMQARVDDMEKNKQNALDEIRKRKLKEKNSVVEEDQFRQKLDPMIKAWSEDFGKKKQLSALLASLHTVLWPGAEWTPVNLGDLFDKKKCTRAFHKATRLVHPDKTTNLDAEKRFLAKRIFDALKQAKSAGENT